MGFFGCFAQNGLPPLRAGAAAAPPRRRALRAGPCQPIREKSDAAELDLISAHPRDLAAVDGALKTLEEDSPA